MSTKPKGTPFNGAHTAGIFSDMSIDGPIIGTLVLVVDRAKNLPNRKTIGKQDPYCAARLGKEAKKTNTDIRGGQTPRWDQELRFTVHDSPDYYQLKVSVFSDDKKTELIGENWVDLRDIVVAGGGQNDQWQPLQCRGKYAGEIRIEITYYDSRPKPKPAAPAASGVAAPAATVSNTGSARGRPTAELSGPNTMGPRALGAANPPKRRPLPSDPVTGQAPVQPQPVARAPSPAPAPAPVPAPAPAPVAVAPPLQAAPAAAPAPVPSPAFIQQQQQAPQHMQTPPRQQPNQPTTYTPSQSPLPSTNYSSNSASPQPVLYQQQPPAPMAPAVQHPDYHDQGAYNMTGPDGAYDSGVLPVTHQHQQQGRHQSHHSHHSHHGHHGHPVHAHDKSQYGNRDFAPEVEDYQQPPYDQQLQQQQQQQQQHHHQESRDYRFDGSPAHIVAPSNMAPAFEDPSYAQPVNDRPPPPPAHRSRNNSSGAPAPDAAFRSSFGAKDNTPAMRREVLRSEAHRHSISSAYPGRPTYRPLEAAPAPSAPAPDPTYQPPPPRHLSRGSSFDGQYNGDLDNASEASSALVASSFRKSTNRPPMPTVPQEQHQEHPSYDYESQGFGKVPSPAPLNLGGNRSSFSASPAPIYNSSSSQHRQSDAGTYMRRSPSPMAPHEYRRSPSPLPGPPAPTSYDTYGSHDDPYRRSSYSELDSTRHRENSEAYMLPAVPASLVPGVDPSLALELRSRIHSEDRRNEQPAPAAQPQQQQQQQQPQHRYTMSAASVMETPPRATPLHGRHKADGSSRASFDYDYNEPSQSQNYTPQRSQFSQSYNTPPQQTTQPPPSRYDRSPGPYSSGVPSPAVYDRTQGASPKPRHTIKRKSVSPAPASVSPQEGERRMSGIPFGPDSYDALNPALAAAKDPVRPDYNEASGKIIAHDGREIDPSDHLPVESWAPEPEPKPPKPESATASPADHSISASGRKQLRIAGRPQSSMGSSGITFSSADDPGTTYTPTGRNRLQKKSNRQSVAAIPVSSGTLSSGSPQASTPLAPLTYPRQQQQQDNFTPPRALVRASTFDYPSENHAPTQYGGSPGRTSYGGPAAPPIPAKVPVGGSPYGGASHTGSYRGSSSFTDSGAGGYADDGDRSPVMSGALMSTGSAARALPWNDSGAGAGHPGSMGDIALIEEMSRIDLGTGRARRHNGRY
ncbi:hypothetical protein SCUCBS95973_006998 [Sporothrix curviconia]|uniref:C2 domain-containing protein n=1 Tax=Sporothrix curviconia TaxID=1260050 RepID=A0ABP0CCA7_9PEZI